MRIIENSEQSKASKILHGKVAEKKNLVVLPNHNIKELRGN